MCFGQPQTLKSGARVSYGTTTETRQFSGNIGGRRLSGTYEQRLHIPMAKTLDTTGASSAAEVFGSKESREKWYAQSPSRPMTEAEYNEYRASPRGGGQGRMLSGVVQGRAKQPGSLSQQYAMQGGKRVPVQSSLLIAPRSYEDYTARAAEVTNRTRTQVGGGTRATGLNI